MQFTKEKTIAVIVNNWKWLVAIFVFFGGNAWLEGQKNILTEIWNLPEERNRLEALSNARYENYTNRLDVLEKKVNKQEHIIEEQADIIEHLKQGQSITSDCLGEELDLVEYWGYHILASNPKNLWIIKEDKYGIRTPLSLQTDWHYKRFFYTPIGAKNKIPLEK